MKLKAALTVLAIAAMTVATTPATWANSLTFQDVTFDLNAGVGNTLILTITNADNATGDWKGIEGLAAFEIKNTGLNYSNLSLADWTVSNDSLNPASCLNGNSSGGGCFLHNGGPLALSHSMTFNINYDAGTLNLSAPSLKVLFTGADQGDGHGNLLSKVISVPEPASVILLGAGLTGIAIWKRRRNSTES